MNPFYETFYDPSGSTQSDGVTYYFAGKDGVDFLKINNDPRIGKFYKPYSDGKWDGNYFGTPGEFLTVQSETSQLGYEEGDEGAMIGTPTKSSPILTDFESLFIQAEAAERGYIAGNAKALYESALTQAFVYVGLSSSLASQFYSQELGTVNYDLATNKLELILNQKWMSLNGVAPVEIWTDYRRSGFPNFLVFSTNPQRENDTPPIRLLYPQREIDTNNDNLIEVGSIDLFSSKIFWQNR
ncbi:MAG: SusD/RagB family nutrient-binding outer membrane lipoprotein [Chloroflexia bacterium]|nr:SusD/RagB family nutrient-binding outer membrane lipoprotein [Chloroflexia bacterium]